MDYQKIIEEALKKVLAEHGYCGAVQNRDIHEQALTHRLAYHLENSNLFIGYHVDCEYNRHGEGKKNDTEGVFRPDIIIHVRGNDNDNLIMIEAKKFNDEKQEIRKASEALIRRKNKYNYQCAFLVTFPENIETLNKNSVLKV
jgi:hypothetical protein